MVYNAIWRASSSYPYLYIYSCQVSMKSAKALPRYGSGHKSAYSKKHFFKKQRAITQLLTDGVQCHLACIIVLSIYILIPSFNEIRPYSKKHFFKIQRAITPLLTDGVQCHLACIIHIYTHTKSYPYI